MKVLKILYLALCLFSLNHCSQVSPTLDEINENNKINKNNKDEEILKSLSTISQAQDDLNSILKFNSIYKKSPIEWKKSQKQQLKIWKKKILAAEMRGEEVACLGQILNETSWLLSSTIDLKRIDNNLKKLHKIFNLPSRKRSLDKQSPIDGSWGTCYNEWFFKLDASSDHLLELAQKHKRPQYQLNFLDIINSPEKLLRYLNSILISDVMKKKKINRRELNEAVSTLIRLIFKLPNEIYSFHPLLKKTLLDFIHLKWQDQETGYFGAWFEQKNHGLIKTPDLSITFHIVSYLKGNVSYLDKILKTTFLLRNGDYPLGWTRDGEYENHHNYDVVRLFRYAYPYANKEQKEKIKSEIESMLKWCLEKSIQDEESFSLDSSDDSLEDSYYFGVSFLDEAGFFNPQKKFWHMEAKINPSAERIRQKLKVKIQKLLKKNKKTGGAKSGFYYQNALEKLQAPNI